MKTSWKIRWITIIVIALSSPVFSADSSDLRLITVTGDAEVRVEPDEVILTFGVETWDKHLNTAKSSNDQCVKKVLEVAKKFEIEKKHVQTDYMSIEPRYEKQWEHRTFIGYFVRKKIIITLRDVSKFEDLLSSALEAGANYVYGVQFRTTELRKYKDQARILAIKAAREKADDLAGELGQKVGKPHTIREDWVGWDSRRGGVMAQNIVQDFGASSEFHSSIALGQIKVTARITVSFELE